MGEGGGGAPLYRYNHTRDLFKHTTQTPAPDLSSKRPVTIPNRHETARAFQIWVALTKPPAAPPMKLFDPRRGSSRLIEPSPRLSRTLG
eukprot:349316-Prymnesium_polylepis.1